MFFTFCVFLYRITYTLNIARAITKMAINEIRNLFLKIVINELDFLMKTVISQWNA